MASDNITVEMLEEVGMAIANADGGDYTEDWKRYDKLAVAALAVQPREGGGGLRALVEKWRAEAEIDAAYVTGAAKARFTCADELERALSEDAGPDRGLRAPCGGGAASSAPALPLVPSEEAIKAAEGAIENAFYENIETEGFVNEARDALRAAYRIDAKPATPPLSHVGPGLCALVDRWRERAAGHGSFMSDDTACLRAVADELEALLDAAPNSSKISNGWKLVPIEPTEAMQKRGAMERAMTMQRFQTAEMGARQIYRAMLSAAPVPPSQGEG